MIYLFFLMNMYFQSFGSTFINRHEQVLSKQDLWLHGRETYQKHCIGCHGKQGDGNGPAAIMLDPKPRNFKTGIFKFKSTSWEALPTDQDLLKTITQGLYGTSMPSFSLLPEVSRVGVIEYIKSFAPDMWSNKDNIKSPIESNYIKREEFQNHETFIAKASKGRQVYIDNCLVCHGKKGHGDGEGSVGLEDEWGEAIRPANLTLEKIKSGRSIQDILKVVLIGIPGTPMPSFKEAISPEDATDVAAYILYLRGLNMGVYNKGKTKEHPPIPEIKDSDI